ncbi:DinB family protein [Microlunatus sp. Gsoil 973]|uniref:DinB family protein n=1 Tax=Microlunatus sp. Gsoil 973 TaxID=2672569 RepID=UPI002104E0C9|nr:DinB family protein [Microlunatus sp. Gsoil 973]
MAEPFDPERVVIVDDGTEGVRAGVVLAQAINHANHHREQVCAILTGLGIQPPDIQAWAYAWHTARIWRIGS